MERCFIVEKGSELERDYREYKAITKENEAKIKAFVKDNITTNKEFYYAQNSSVLQISLTPEEATKYASQTKNGFVYSNGRKIYTFKKNSAIGKAYAKLDIKPMSKPSPTFYVFSYFSGRTRLFEDNGVVYCSIDSEQLEAESAMPKHWKEIKKSDFYKIIEESER